MEATTVAHGHRSGREQKAWWRIVRGVTVGVAAAQAMTRAWRGTTRHRTAGGQLDTGTVWQWLQLREAWPRGPAAGSNKHADAGGRARESI
ncbi:hypothetical protein NL676_025602 [Syzygium grande]|nr:hypothetical protein NL676_025602 [Syzygium grande]